MSLAAWARTVLFELVSVRSRGPGVCLQRHGSGWSQGFDLLNTAVTFISLRLSDRVPVSLYLFIYLSPSLSASFSFSLTLIFYTSVSHPFSLSPSLSLSFSLSLFIPPFLPPPPLSLPLPLSLSLPPSLCMCSSFFNFFPPLPSPHSYVIDLLTFFYRCLHPPPPPPLWYLIFYQSGFNDTQYFIFQIFRLSVSVYVNIYKLFNDLFVFQSIISSPHFVFHVMRYWCFICIYSHLISRANHRHSLTLSFQSLLCHHTFNFYLTSPPFLFIRI